VNDATAHRRPPVPMGMMQIATDRVDAAYRCSVLMHVRAGHIIEFVYRRPNAAFVQVVRRT